MSTPLVLDLTKARDALVLDLSKAGVLEIPTMETRLALDFSTSMSEEYEGGLVQRTIDRFLAAALTFDDNETLDVGFFSSTWKEAPSATKSDLGKYLAKHGMTRPGGGTHYGPIIQNFESRQVQSASAVTEPVKKAGFLSRIFGGAQAPAPTPTSEGTSPYRAYVGVITDGDNMDPAEFERQMAKTSGDTFFQFFAIGNQVNLNYLTRIAANYPHMHFIHIPQPTLLSDEDFFELLANEKFASWING